MANIRTHIWVNRTPWILIVIGVFLFFGWFLLRPYLDLTHMIIPAIAIGLALALAVVITKLAIRPKRPKPGPTMPSE
jgi:hypothetical protein